MLASRVLYHRLLFFEKSEQQIDVFTIIKVVTRHVHVYEGH